MKWIVRTLEILGWRRKEETSEEGSSGAGIAAPVIEKEAPEQLPLPSLPSIEIFARSGHGRSSFIWASLYMFRQLTRIWPEFICWPQDETTAVALKTAYRNLHQGILPAKSDAGALKYSLLLRNMERWGQQEVLVWDRGDPVYSSELLGELPSPPNWQVPALWLLSLSDLDDVDGWFLDSLFDDLIRSRLSSGISLQSQPFRLVVVLSKADAIPNLPLTVRCYLREDPLWRILGNDDESKQLAPRVNELDSEMMTGYVASMWRVHEEIKSWLAGTQAGQVLIQRAEEYHVDLRFCAISATGSGALRDDGLGLRWAPRRVLDPYFWAFEMESIVYERAMNQS